MGVFIFIRIVPAPWSFVKILGTPFRYWGFIFIYFFLTFSGGGSEVFDEFGLNLRTSCWVPPSNILIIIRSCLRVSYFPITCMEVFLWDLAYPLVPCFLRVSMKFSEGMLHKCEQCPRKSYICLLFSLSRDRECIDGISSLLSNGIYFGRHISSFSVRRRE